MRFDHSDALGGRRPEQTRPGVAVLGLVAATLAVVLAGAACGRTAEEQAAVDAQEACITALGPVARQRLPSEEDLRAAARDAGAAARVDERWVPLRRRVSELRTAVAGQDGRGVDALAQECRRVNDIVKQERDDV